MDGLGIGLIILGSILGIGFIAYLIYHFNRAYRGEDDSDYEMDRR